MMPFPLPALRDPYAIPALAAPWSGWEKSGRPGWLDSATGRTVQLGSCAAAALMTGSTVGEGSKETIRPVYPRERSRCADCPGCRRRRSRS